MEIRFYATLRDVTGGRTAEFDLEPGTTVAGLLAAVVARYPAIREELFDEKGDLYPHVHVFINGRDAPYLDHALETPLRETDKVDIFPAIGGG
jgi:molybdopterin synthase sulfur carrier subunit